MVESTSLMLVFSFMNSVGLAWENARGFLGISAIAGLTIGLIGAAWIVVNHRSLRKGGLFFILLLLGSTIGSAVGCAIGEFSVRWGVNNNPNIAQGEISGTLAMAGRYILCWLIGFFVGAFCGGFYALKHTNP